MEKNEKLWEASSEMQEKSHIQNYINWLSTHKQLDVTDYPSLWQWSIVHVGLFWESILQYFNIQYDGIYQSVMTGHQMPQISWFEGIKLNYAEHIFRNKSDADEAMVFRNEAGVRIVYTWREVKKQVASFQQYLKNNGIGKGDRCVAYLPNIPEAIFAFLACNASGVIWSSCSPDFGVSSVIDRFAQIEPKILITCDGYFYGGKKFDRFTESARIKASLPSAQYHVKIGYLSKENDEWNRILEENNNTEIEFARVDFAHPIWVLYSSGTTGIPKAITHSCGGILLEHFKYIFLQNEVHAGQKYFWYSTTGWMMWNFANSSLLADATLFLYDGSPGYPDLHILWDMAREEKIHHFGTSAPFLVACMKKNISLLDRPLPELISIGSTGAPLPFEAFEYVYEHISPSVWLSSMAGGTDVCTAFVGSNVLSPVKKGKIQGRALGVALYAYNEDGDRVINTLGEMVIEQPMPSMPVFFWNDEAMARYKSSYFEHFPGVWRHGDWISIDKDGQIVIHGRSDATLNRQGIRIGTSEIYSSTHKIKEIEDALIINIEFADGSHFMPLFVKLKSADTLSEEMKGQINRQLRSDYSPRHVPDVIIEVPDIPYTLSGKKLEAPVKKILMGISPEKAANKEATKNPEALAYFVKNKDKILDLKK